MSDHDPSSKDIFWQTWQRVSEYTLIANYHIEDYYVADFAHLPTKTIIPVDHPPLGSLRTWLLDKGWHIHQIKSEEIQRDVQACVRKISMQITYRAINLQKKEEKPPEKPIQPPKISIVKPPSKCRECGSEVTHGFHLCFQCQARVRVKRAQLPIVRWAKAMMQQDDWIVLNTETTGTYQWSEVLEIAIVDSQGRTLLHTLLKPKKGILRTSTDVHGITKEDVKGAPEFAEIWPQISLYLEKYTILAYDIGFNLRMLKQNAQRCKKPFPENVQSVSLKQKYTSYQRPLSKGKSTTVSLEQACQQLGLPSVKHRALPDAQTIWELVKKLSEQE